MRILTAGFFTTLNRPMVKKSLGFLLLPWRWRYLRHGPAIARLEGHLSHYLGVPNIYSFGNGRGALYHALKLINIEQGDEIIIQAFTCVSVPNAIIQAGAHPIYADIKETTLNIDPESIEQKISSKTKAIIIQHTFGIPADLQKIISLCNKHHLFLIEDCAHALGAESPRGRKLGSWGDLAIFSLGRDKVISSVSGGFLVINNPALNKKYVHKVKETPLILIIRSLLYPPLAYLSRLTYHLFIGKIIIYLARKLSLIPEILSGAEKKCHEHRLSYALPNALAELGLTELKRIDRYNRHRQEVAQFYSLELSNISHQESRENSNSIFLRYTIFVDRSAALINFARKQRIFLGDWYRWPVAPRGVDYARAMYQQGSCPVAEKQASRTINLPNHPDISIADAKKVVKIIKQFYDQK